MNQSCMLAPLSKDGNRLFRDPFIASKEKIESLQKLEISANSNEAFTLLCAWTDIVELIAALIKRDRLFEIRLFGPCK